MDIRILKGTSLLDCQGLHENNRVYLPAQALDSYVGLWQELAFFNSPLAGKRLCITVLSPSTFADALPPALDHFLELCSAAGAQIIFHNGGKFPQSDLILAVEPGGTHTYVKYIGSTFRSRPLAEKVAANIKQGLKLAFLPDPVAFNKPQYNLKMGIRSRLFTPAVAVQWPANLETLGTWLFTSLMEHFGKGASIDGTLFSKHPKLVDEVECSSPSPSEPEEVFESSPVPVHDPIQASEPPPAPVPVRAYEPPPVTVSNPVLKQRQYPGRHSEPARTWRKEAGGNSASMSRAQYPDLFARLNWKRKPIKKEPFT